LLLRAPFDLIFEQALQKLDVRPLGVKRLAVARL
jgi:hypothetical protein